MYLLVLFLPFTSWLIIALFGRFLGDRGNIILACTNMFLSVVLTLVIYYEVVISEGLCFFKLFPWINVMHLNIEWGLLFDSLTVSMLLLVTIVSCLVHFYSIEYMKEDPYVSCFMSYLSLFTFCMILLITSDNFLQMFVGWEGVGLCSFLLITFWTTRYKANFAALKAMMINRIGDFFLILSIILIFTTFRTLDYIVIFGLIDYHSEMAFLISIFVLLGAMSKSAQLGLHTWLPDAMEGPTPVSALIHAATMVTAGIFVLIRIAPILEQSVDILAILTIFGALTAFFSAMIAIFQNDLKKVIAYSTCSQLGYMLYACGLSNYSVSLFHLLNHGFFKALLFLSSGVIIHALFDEQDMRKMGGLIKVMPFTYLMMFIGSISLMGFPFLTGFYSKDLLLELGAVGYSVNGAFLYWINVLTAFCTAYYSFRLFYLTFFIKTNTSKYIIEHAHDASFFMMVALTILCVGSIFFGYIFKDIYVGLGTNIIYSSLGVAPANGLILQSEYLTPFYKNIPLIFSLSGVIFSFLVNKYGKKFIYNCVGLMNYDLNIFISNFVKNKLLQTYLSLFFVPTQKWGFDLIYKLGIMYPTLRQAYSFFLIFCDRGILELIGPIGILRETSRLVKMVNEIQTSYIFHYLYIIVVILAVLIFYSLVIIQQLF